MIARLEHRGPDDLGSYRDAHAALGFRRLSILDLPGGHGKAPIAATAIVAAEGGQYEIEDYRGSRHRYPPESAAQRPLSPRS